MAFAGLAEPQVSPQRAEHPDRHVDPEHRAPVDRRQQAARDQADELAGQPGDLVGTQREASPVGRKRVGQDRRRVRHQHGSAHRLQDPPADQPDGAPAGLERVKREQDRGEREHDETGVVDLHPAVHVAEAAEADHEHRLHEPVTHDHPQQVEDAAGSERVQPDATEDGRQRDDHDRAVERGHEHGGGGVRQRYPPVAIVDVRHGSDGLR
jgi:hypothetical protein